MQSSDLIGFPSLSFRNQRIQFSLTSAHKVNPYPTTTMMASATTTMTQEETYYQPELEVYCSDGREEELLNSIRNHPEIDEIRGSPARVLAAIDDYGRRKNFLMNVGRFKGPIVAEEIAQRKPKTMVELGGYIGYSAILFGSRVRDVGGSKYITLELNQAFADVAIQLIKIAGLGEFCEILVGPCRQSLREKLPQLLPNGQLDLVFLDHSKKDYANDLRLMEETGLIKKGTTIIADNVITPGAPLYLEYVRFSVVEKVELAEAFQKDSGQDLSRGNPKLIYNNKHIKGLEPTGREVYHFLSFSYLFELTWRYRMDSKSRNVLERRRPRFRMLRVILLRLACR